MELELWQLALLTAVGIVGGFLNVMAGGGSLLTVPVMVFMGLPGPVANGTNRIAILAQNLTAIVTFFRRGFADFKLSMSLAACALPGAVVGALVGTQLDGPWFNRALAVIMVGVMLVMHFDRGTTQRPADYQPTSRQLVRGHLLMVAAGMYRTGAITPPADGPIGIVWGDRRTIRLALRVSHAMPDGQSRSCHRLRRRAAGPQPCGATAPSKSSCHNGSKLSDN